MKQQNYRRWWLLATAIMRNHIHVVAGVPGDPSSDSIVRDYKSYTSRALNRGFGTSKSETWWTESGSKQKLPNEDAIVAAVLYVARQESPPVIWINERLREIVLGSLGESAMVSSASGPV